MLISLSFIIGLNPVLRHLALEHDLSDVNDATELTK